MKPRSEKFLLSSLFIISILCILASINEIRFNFNVLRNFGSCALASFYPTFTNNYSSFDIDLLVSDSSTNSPSDLRVLIGIPTHPDDYDRRHFLRIVYGVQYPINGAQVDVKFMLCNLTTEVQQILIGLEIMRHNDIFILNCTENIDSGMTYTYFSSLPDVFNDKDRPYPPYHYVVKAVADTYFRLQNLMDHLMPLPREDLYFGYVNPCPSMDPFNGYMSGKGYMVSWDIVEWIKESEIPRNHLNGPEDKVFAEWLNTGQRAKNRFTGKWSMYDYPVPPTPCSHEFWPDTIAVHNLKDQQSWIQTLNYFNATSDLKPSKLYHLS